jgi:glucosyl-dolichyl phosphate glucuronosyltransferase
MERMHIPSGFDWEIVVVDNNSTDNTATLLSDFERDSTLPFRHVFERRQGKSFALNTGIRVSRGDILAFTDDDVHVDEQWISSLHRVFDDPTYIGAGGKIIPVWNCERPSWFQTEGPYRLMNAIVNFDAGSLRCELTRPPYGANFAFRRIAFEKYGLFRTDVGPTTGSLIRGEDVEFCARLMSAREKLVYEPGAIVFHPVESYRTRKDYFLSWYFDCGRFAVRSNGIPTSTVCCFGVPRYLLRRLFTNVMLWTFSVNAQRRFYYKLDAFLSAGEIVEAYRLATAIQNDPS